jgi:hypothetical protein
LYSAAQLSLEADEVVVTGVVGTVGVVGVVGVVVELPPFSVISYQ